MARFTTGSRYTNGIVSVNRNNDQFVVLRNLLILPPAPTDIYMTVTNTMLNRPDSISVIAYQRPDLWWAIFDVNGIKDMFSLQVNMRLRIPQLDTLLAAIDTLNNNL